MKTFIIFVAVISMMAMEGQGAPINSDSTKQNTTAITSYSDTNIAGLLEIAYLQVIHTEQSVLDLEREMVSTQINQSVHDYHHVLLFVE